MELERCLVQAESDSDRRGIRVSWQLAEELRPRTGGGATGGAAANRSHDAARAAETGRGEADGERVHRGRGVRVEGGVDGVR